MTTLTLLGGLIYATTEPPISTLGLALLVLALLARGPLPRRGRWSGYSGRRWW